MKSAFRPGIAALLAVLAFFLFLSVDLQLRIWDWRTFFESRFDAYVILALEIARTLVLGGAMALVAAVAVRRGGEPGGRAAALALAFLALAYAQGALAPFPGVQQERLALWLRSHGVPEALLAFAFASRVWPLWPAAAALLRFAACAGPVDAEAVHASAAADRRGLLRGTRAAGADVGAAFRTLSVRLLHGGALRPAPLAALAAAGGLLHHALRAQPLAQLAAAVLLGTAGGVAITLLRAQRPGPGGADRGRWSALGRGAAWAGLVFALAALLSLVPGARAAEAAATLLTLAPLPLLAGAARALLGAREPLVSDVPARHSAIMNDFLVGSTRLRLVRGDITSTDTDGIVNAANSSLLGGGGVDGAIHRQGGPEILEECQRLRSTLFPDGLPTGHAVSTTGGALAARRVIHTVAPVWQGGGQGEPELLAAAYRSALTVALEDGLRSVAFPSLGTGAFGYPVGRAAPVALGTAIEFLREHEGAFTEVRFVLFSQADERAHAAALAALVAGAQRAGT